MDLYKENFNTKYWDPFRNLINPGDMVVLKPNMVMHENENKKFSTVFQHILNSDIHNLNRLNKRTNKRLIKIKKVYKKICSFFFNLLGFNSPQLCCGQ